MTVPQPQCINSFRVGVMAAGPSHEMPSADHVMGCSGEGKGHEPTFVMGASIVMEWIRAIEECRLCELPGGGKDNKITLMFSVNSERKYLICLTRA